MALNLSTLKTPGVYIDEVPTLPSSIIGVETAIPAFIGYVERMVINGKNIIADANRDIKAVRIASMKQYEDIFGGPKKDEAAITVNIEESGRVENGRKIVESTNVFVNTVTAKPKFLMWYQMQMYFANGGGPCYIVPAGSYATANAPDATQLKTTLTEIVATLDEPTLIVFPDGVSLASASDLYSVYQAALQQCFNLKDRFTIIDLKDNTGGAVDTFRGASGIGNSADQLRYGAAYHPWLKTAIEYAYDEANITVNQIFTNNTPPPAAADGAGGGAAGGGAAAADAGDGAAAQPNYAPLHNLKLNNEAFKTSLDYYNRVKQAVRNVRIDLPPSGAMAGVYAFVDNARGVWKAPANVGVNNISGVAIQYTDEEQKSLNVDLDGGKSINIIRNFTGQGIKVWGARTLEGNSNEWRYVNVRRFFNFVEESVKKGMNAYVFESNDANTWIKVRSSIESFLRLQWQAGALQGSKPEQAYFVRVGLGVTMSPDDVFNGRLIVDVGMAVVRPAEFIVLRFMHKIPEA